MKEKKLYTASIKYHYAHTNGYNVTKLIDTSDSDQGIIKFLDSESDTQPIRVKFFPNYARNFDLDNKDIEVDTYCGIVSSITSQGQNNKGYILTQGGYGQHGLHPTQINNVITYDSNKGYCWQHPIVNQDPRSISPWYIVILLISINMDILMLL